MMHSTRLDEVVGNIQKRWDVWFENYADRLKKETFSDEERKDEMNAVLIPKYVLRNYMAQLAIDDADKGDYKLIDELFQLAQKTL